jgi:hypothetical protein
MVQDRFERAPGGAGAKIANREESRAVFLGRMWTLFGPPDAVGDGGFSYGLRDRDTGLLFEAYAGPTGPAYGGPIVHRDDLAPVIDAFERLLDQTPLADCTLELPLEEGHDVIGVEHGAPFERHVRPEVDRVAEATQTLASEHPDPMIYYLAMVKLAEVSPDEHALLGELWRRALGAAVAQLDRQLAGPSPDRTALMSVLDVTLPALEDTAALAGVDPAAALRPLRSKLDAARRALA